MSDLNFKKEIDKKEGSPQDNCVDQNLKGAFQ